MAGEERWAWQVIDEVEKAVVGKREILTKIMTAILAGGHILIEDIPGTGRRQWRWHFPGRWGWR